MLLKVDIIFKINTPSQKSQQKIAYTHNKNLIFTKTASISKEIDKEKQMKKILFLLLVLILSAFSAAAQPTANGTDLKLPDISYAALNKELDKTVAALNDGKTSVEQSGAILDRLEEIQGQINQTLPAFLTAQDNLQKK